MIECIRDDVCAMSNSIEPKFVPSHPLIRWIRRHFTRDAVLDFLKTFVWVAPLSVLIWIYADKNTENTEGKQPIAFQIVVKDPSKVVTLLNNTERLVTADLKGSRARLDSVKSKLKPGEVSIQIDVPENQSLGPTNLQLALSIQNAPLFREYGIYVTNVTPSSIPVVVDKLEKLTVNVVPPDDAANLGSPPIFLPREVTLTAPASLIAQARAQNQPIQAIADLSQNAELKQPGKHEAVVPIRASIYGEHVALDRAAVTVAIEIKANDKQGTIRSMPVKLDGFKTYFDEVDVQCAAFVPNIRISGPADLVDRLTSTGTDKLDSYAILSIDRFQDPPGKSGSKPLKFSLPPGVSVIAEDAQKPFEYTLVKKAQ